MKHLINLLPYITIEPLILLYFTVSALTVYASGNLIIQKACYPDLTSEPDFSNPCPDEEHAQKLISDIGIWRPFLEYPLPVVIIIFLGAWSDSHGKRRKPLFFVPIIGDIITNMFIMVSIYYWEMSASLTSAVSAVLHGLGGGPICFAFAAFTYISDVTTPEQRTMRLSILSAVTFIGPPLGSVLGGVLRMEIGFFKLFALCLFANIVTLGLAVLLIKNTETLETKLKTFESVCDPSAFVISLKTVFKKRRNNKRSVVMLMVLLSPVFISVYVGEPLYLFFRYKFHYDEVQFGYYSAYKSVTLFVGNIISVYICSKVFAMTDASIGCVAAITQSVYLLAMTFLAQYRWQLYAFAILDLMQGAVYTAGRAIISKTADGSELAQVLSVLGASDSLVPLLVYPCYSLVYKYTFVTMPGAFFLLSLFLVVILFFLFFGVFVIQRRQRQNKEVEDS